MMGDAIKIMVRTSACFPCGYARHLENISWPTLKPEDSHMQSEVSVLHPVQPVNSMTCNTPPASTPMQDATPSWQHKVVQRSSALRLLWAAPAQLH